MNRIKIFVVLFIGSFTGAVAQDNYTYISDRKFFDPNDLIGYDFRPGAMEVRGTTEKELSAGEYSFGISRSNLYVDGGNIKGVYSVNNINPTEYGYKLLLMNARDPTVQGHLKVILNKWAQVEALVFKRSNKEEEIIFFQTPITEKLYNQEAEYFTDKNDFSMEEPDSVWGKKIYPFLRIHNEEGGIQERLQMADSTSIEFVEKITIIEKKKKKRKKKSKEEETEEVVEVEGEAEAEEETVVIEEIEESEGVEEDLGAVPPIEAAENMEEAISEDQKEDVKIKIVKEYFINIRTILTFEDGSVEDKTEEIPIKNKFALFETNANGNPTIEPYELEISPKKGSPISMRLTKNKTISSIHIEGKTYLMRGH
jgi:hypothetical protein